MNVSASWPAPAKINLFLHITGRRSDNYHDIQTLFQFIDLYDQLDFMIRDDGVITRQTQLPGVDASDDLVVLAAKSLQKHCAVKSGVDISVKKNIPMGAGLGGGSSDAATVLVALNYLWGLELPTEELAELGLRLGADVPIFIHGQAAWAEGVGEKLSFCEPDVGPIIVVTPQVSVATAQIFGDSELTRDTKAIKMHDFSLELSHNDCEPVTCRLYPEVANALFWLSGYGAAKMSGTGAAVFICIESDLAAENVFKVLPKQWKGHCGGRMNQSPLLSRLHREAMKEKI
ncbi:MAG: 4-(cytidine 5'-diphospho)-2-C-methyl-D-erythritol kinase [Proteobacteria bacterium]|nr:4-(cytidine 5'-diphospho)-2-C-methyl-D-erythritol kinase [Pseudomonadota bacterium]